MPPPIKRTTPLKSVPKKATTKDDIRDWQDNQPAVAVFREPGDDADGTFPSGDESLNGERVEEQAPNIPSPLLVKARELGEKARGSFSAPKKTSVSKVRQRVSVDKLIGTAWGILSQVTAPINLPVARVFAIQAPVAGLVLEDVVKNTIVDRLLQPIARVEAGGEVAFALLGPPVLVAAMTKFPERAPILVPLLRQSLRAWIDIAGPKLEHVAKQEAKFEEQYGQRIDEMIAFFVSPPEQAPDDRANHN